MSEKNSVASYESSKVGLKIIISLIVSNMRQKNLLFYFLSRSRMVSAGSRHISYNVVDRPKNCRKQNIIVFYGSRYLNIRIYIKFKVYNIRKSWKLILKILKHIIVCQNGISTCAKKMGT